MAKIAIDVVLLLSENMTDKAIEINKELLKTHEKKIILDKQKCLPHISLCMGVIEEEKLPEIKKVLENIAKEFSNFNLTAKDFEIEIIPTGKKLYSINIKNTESLQKLHETVMKRLWDYLSYDVEISMLFNPPEIEEVTLHWIKNYHKHHENPSKFQPHITAGFGETDKFKFPIKFKASKLAMCQLGNYCTCRKVMISKELKKMKE